MNFDICQINTSKLDDETKLPLIQAFVPITGDDDYESFGEVASYQALGVVALPYPPDDGGFAEGVILRDVGAFNGAVVGARDERCAGVVASMQPGDVVLHSCDPKAKAQVRCHANRQLALVTEGTDEKTIALVLDGSADKVQIAAFGGLIQLSPDGIALVAPEGKSSILLNKDGSINIIGKVQIGGLAGTHNVLAGIGTLVDAFKALPTADAGAPQCSAALVALKTLLVSAGNMTAEGK